jgi:hypothetical protein
MREADYYAPGSYNDPAAPWNQEDVPEKEFEVTCSQSLSRTATVWTSNYIPGASGVDYEPDGDGGYCASGWQDPDDTSDTNWAEEYHDNQYHTPAQLLELFKQCLEENMKNGLVFKTPKFTEDLIKECEGWSEDETEYIEES